MLSSPASRRRERGSVMMLVAPMLVAVFASAAFAVDLGFARQESRHAQAAADAGALAGVRKLPLISPDATAAATAETTAAQNVNRNLTGSSSTPTIVTCGGDAPPGAQCFSVDDAIVTVATPYVGTWAGAPPSHNLIYVQVCRPSATFFAGVMGLTGPEVCREAIGRRRSASGGLGLGLVVLDPAACGALTFQGNSTTVLSSNGAVMVNSECVDGNSGALDSSGSSWNLEASFIGVVGNATLSPCDPEITTTCTTTVPTEGIPHFDDPLQLSPPDPVPAISPTFLECSTSGSGVRLLLPGRYPNYCSFQGNRQYIFRPGVYYFDQGFKSAGSAPLVCSNTATVHPLPADSTCDGVTLIVADGSADLTGSGKVFLPPPTSGPYEGVTIYQMSADSSTINGTSEFVLGTIYAPDAHYEFTGTGGSDYVNINGMVVTETAHISGSFSFNINVPEEVPFDLPQDDIGLER